VLLRAATSFIACGLEFLALNYTDVSKVVLILYNPFISVFISFFTLRESVTSTELISFILGLAGVVLLIDPLKETNNKDDILGIVISLLCAVIFQIGYVATRYLRNKVHPI